MTHKVKISASRRKGEYTFFNGENEVKPEFTNAFRVTPEIASQITNKQLIKSVKLIIPLKLGLYGYELMVRKIKRSKFMIALDFGKDLVLALDPSKAADQFTAFESIEGLWKKLVFVNNFEIPGGVVYYQETNSVSDVLTQSETIMSALINCFQLRK